MDDLLTIDELAQQCGITVRTARYYVELGLVPPPIRRGRQALYGPLHLARLRLVQALQHSGLTLQAIEKHLATLHADASLEDLALQRIVWGSLTAPASESLDLAEVAKRAGRDLTTGDLEWLAATNAITPETPERWRVTPFVDLAVALRDSDFPQEILIRANAAVRRHLEALGDELHTMFADYVDQRYPQGQLTAAQLDELEATTAHLRRLSVEAVVAGFHRVQRRFATRSLRRS